MVLIFFLLSMILRVSVSVVPTKKHVMPAILHSVLLLLGLITCEIQCTHICSRYQVPNLAGLARTCEIFAASRLIVPDLRVIKNPSFSKISTGAEQWLPIEELGDKQLLTWIRRVKEQGYTLVGIEQTNNSVCLTKVRL